MGDHADKPKDMGKEDDEETPTTMSTSNKNKKNEQQLYNGPNQKVQQQSTHWSSITLRELTWSRTTMITTTLMII